MNILKMMARSAAAVSLLLGLVIAILWIRSYSTPEQTSVSKATSKPDGFVMRHLYVESTRGSLGVYYVVFSVPGSAETRAIPSTGMELTHAHSPQLASPYTMLKGRTGFTSQAFLGAVFASRNNRASFSSGNGVSLNGTSSYRILAVRYWHPLVLTLILPGAWAVKRGLKRRRHSHVGAFPVISSRPAD